MRRIGAPPAQIVQQVEEWEARFELSGGGRVGEEVSVYTALTDNQRRVRERRTAWRGGHLVRVSGLGWEVSGCWVWAC
jgi:hypothetical protein